METLPVNTLLEQGYVLARQRLGQTVPLVVLHLGAQQGGIAVGEGPQLQTSRVFDLGLERLAARHFLRSPPTPLAMENAITEVEDLVMPLHSVIPAGALLVSCDAALHEVAHVAGASTSGLEPLELTLQALERCFNRLSYVVEGRPAAYEGLPDSTAFAAALLVLRECMHHWQLSRLVLLPAAAA